MFFSKTVIVGVVAVLAVCFAATTNISPKFESLEFRKRFDAMGGLDFIQICLNNCAQCKKMFGDYFIGQMCAESCLKFEGKAIPDCEDIKSIEPFLTAFQ